jgi:predicted MFS family arabinose efflux permease
MAGKASGIILSLNGSSINLGVGLGALIGGIVLQYGNIALLGIIGDGSEILALALLWLSRRPGSLMQKKQPVRTM